MSRPKGRGEMGFRDFACFDKALLAKQCWRLWKMSDSLITRIMKAKYFPNCLILDASQGRNPSFAWRSIQKSCELLMEGLIWRVEMDLKYASRWTDGCPTLLHL
jgi:hypothetical protein